MDWPALLLTSAVRRMPVERGEWGAAMLAELAHLQHPFVRWQFALGCARVALFPPHRGGFLMNDRMKHWLTTFGVAALFSLLLTGTFMFLSLFQTPLNFSREMFPFPGWTFSGTG